LPAAVQFDVFCSIVSEGHDTVIHKPLHDVSR
jgi:hypothetical protein